MPSQQEEEQENHRRLKKLVSQVGLPLLKKLFVSRYHQYHGEWKETPECGEKLLKMLDDQNSSNEAEKKEKHKERQNILSGKVSKWDHTTLKNILTQVQFGLDTNNPTAAGRSSIDTENDMVCKLTQVRNKLAHEYFDVEQIPTEEFIKLWNKSWDSCLYLKADEADMYDIYPSYVHPSQRGRNSRRDLNSTGQGHRSNSGGRGGARSNSGNRTFVTSSFSSTQPGQVKNPTTSSNYKSKAPVALSLTSSEARGFVPLSYGKSSSTTTTTFAASRDALPRQQRAYESFTGNTYLSTSWILFLMVHGISLVVVSSLFLLRLQSQLNQNLPPHLINCTIVALSFGAFRIILSILCCCLLVRLRESNVHSRCLYVVGFFYVLTLLVFGFLAICFARNYSALVDSNDVAGRKNYNLYWSILSLLSIEPAVFIILLCFVVCLFFGQ